MIGRAAVSRISLYPYDRRGKLQMEGDQRPTPPCEDILTSHTTGFTGKHIAGVSHGAVLPDSLVERVPIIEKLILSFVLEFLESTALPASGVASGERRVASGEWRVASGEWRAVSGEGRVIRSRGRVASPEW